MTPRDGHRVPLFFSGAAGTAGENLAQVLDPSGALDALELSQVLTKHPVPPGRLPPGHTSGLPRAEPAKPDHLFMPTGRTHTSSFTLSQRLVPARRPKGAIQDATIPGGLGE